MHKTANTATHPPWLAAVLGDTGDAPRLFRHTAASYAQAHGLAYRRPARADKDDARRIYVVGLGNLGRLFAAGLAQAPEAPPVTLVVRRRDLLAAWAARPALVLSGQPVAADFDVEMWSDDENANANANANEDASDGEVGPVHNLVVATKAADAVAAVDRVRRYLSRDSTVAFVQNGVARLWAPLGKVYEAHRFGDASRSPTWLACVVTHGLTSEGAFSSRHASHGRVVVGCVNRPDTAPVPELGRLISASALLDGAWVARPALWLAQAEKLAVNCVLNPLTALLDVPNGGVLGPDLADVVTVLVGEASAVLTAAATHAMQPGGVLDGLGVAEQVAALERLAVPALLATVLRVGAQVRANTSSMLQDVRAGRTTEIRELNGWLVDMARFLGLQQDGRDAVAAHATLVDMVLDKSQVTKVTCDDISQRLGVTC